MTLPRWLVGSEKTVRRLKRTALQVAAGGALGALVTAIFVGKEAIPGAIAAALAAFVAAWGQNTLEDAQKIKDRRP